jgi:hypothetical protein
LKKYAFFKSQFLKTQFPNDLCSVIWFKNRIYCLQNRNLKRTCNHRKARIKFA